MCSLSSVYSHVSRSVWVLDILRCGRGRLMDSDFRAILEESNIKGRLIDHLEAQDITDEEIFRSLKSDELRLVFDRAGPLVSVGQFSLLCRLWERETGLEGELQCLYTCTVDAVGVLIMRLVYSAHFIIIIIIIINFTVQ